MSCEKLYLRFTDNINADIRKGYSTFKGGEDLDGLCAWPTPFDIVHGVIINSNNENASMNEIEAYKEQILNNTYGSYSSNDLAYLITGDYVGNGNDGVLLKNVEVVKAI